MPVAKKKPVVKKTVKRTVNQKKSVALSGEKYVVAQGSIHTVLTTEMLAELKKRDVKSSVATKGKKPSAHNIIGNIEKWSINDKRAIIEAGVSKSEFEEVKKETGLDYETLSHILSVTKATLHNKKGNQKFNAVVTERLLLLAEIYVFGIEVFGEKERFNRWLVSDIRALGYERPVDFLRTLYGMTEVKHLIGRIAYGVYS